MHGTTVEQGAGLLDHPMHTSDDDFDPRQLVVRGAAQMLSFFEYAKSSPRQLLARFLWFLVPSFLQGRSAGSPKAKLGPTAYLDGLRGAAALGVFFCHHTYEAYNPDVGWGCGGGYYGFLRLPILRLTHSGRASVALFFVISGYALSYKPVGMIRSRNMLGFGPAMSSMVFRRALRLYLPTVVSTALIVVFLRLGLYEPTRDFSMDHTYFRHMLIPHKDRFDSGLEQWMDWANNVLYSLVLFNWDKQDGLNAYDGFLWTIPIEYRCSLYLFLVYIGTSRLKTRYRIMSLMLITYITYRKARWDFLLFLYGLACVEWDYARGAHAHMSTSALPPSEKGPTNGSRRLLRVIAWNMLSVLALYLLSQPPSRSSETPGWKTLGSMIPEWWEGKLRDRYWQGFGAGLFVLSMGHSAFWQRVFNADAMQYLGKISYSLYLVHGRVSRGLQYTLLKFVFEYLTGTEGDDYYRGFWIGSCITIPAVICCADVFWRAVDIPIVKFSRWFETKLVAKNA
ncbi:acyltransferase 3 [Dactylonectria estremocensis]|uniref:Acyltransferase 3 n=1 Tax=Dactylonectria estremocensis TaxID=1079267 RepID=A0A9P9FDC7_9HYPO|nr:acyltransferase 3 [Dactylonectria estremocensis]